MVDAKTGAGDDHIGESKTAPQSAPTPEPTILEETVIKPAPTKTQPAAEPVDTISTSLPPSLPRDLPPPQKPPELPAQKLEVPPPPLPAPSAPPPATPSPPAPSATPAPTTHTPEQFAQEQETIANILKEVKIPERHTPELRDKASKIFDTALGATSVPEPSPPTLAASPPEKAVPQTQAPQGGAAAGVIAPLRTLKDDLQEIVKVKKISLVKAAALESDKRARAHILRGEAMRSSHTRRALRILFAALLFLLLGGAGFFGIYLINQERSGARLATDERSILFAESVVSLPLNNTPSLDLKRILLLAREGNNATLGSITEIVPTFTALTESGEPVERPAALEEYLRALGARASPDLLRALSERFFFGIHTVDENAPFFVIPVTSYEHAFAGMLAWEQTMNADLAPSFSPVPDQVLGSGGLPEKRRFEDIVMRNYDVRALKDDRGEIQLYYSFPTQHLLIIAESPYTFTEVLSRLRAERKL